MRDKKQNVFDDFIYAAEELIKLKYTKPEKYFYFFTFLINIKILDWPFMDIQMEDFWLLYVHNKGLIFLELWLLALGISNIFFEGF